MKALKTLFSLLLILGTIAATIAQNSNEWMLHKEINGIKIFSKHTECKIDSEGFHQEMVLLRFENTTNLSQSIEWQLEAWYYGPGYEGKCTTCELDEYKYSLIIPANTTITGECDIYSERKLKIFSKFLNLKSDVGLEKFNISILKIYPN